MRCELHERDRTLWTSSASCSRLRFSCHVGCREAVDVRLLVDTATDGARLAAPAAAAVCDRRLTDRRDEAADAMDRDERADLEVAVPFKDELCDSSTERVSWPG